MSIVLMAIPGEPLLDPTTQAQIRDLSAKGLAGTVFLNTEDCRADYERLRANGVEFTEAPEERPYSVRLTRVSMSFSA